MQLAGWGAHDWPSPPATSISKGLAMVGDRGAADPGDEFKQFPLLFRVHRGPG
jgi:hypothetical protein